MGGRYFVTSESRSQTDKLGFGQRFFILRLSIQLMVCKREGQIEEIALNICNHLDQ
jgi:hypothetical protein